MQTHVEYLCKEVLKLDIKCGLHMFRKTAYLFAQWGGASDIDSMAAARHKTIENAKTYKLDAATLDLLREANSDQNNDVSDWKPIRCIQISNAVELNVHSRPFTKALPELAATFVFTHLRVSPSDPKLKHPCYLADKAMNWMRHKSSAEELNEFLRHVAPEMANNIRRLVHCSAQEQADAYCRSRLESMNTVTAALPVANASVASLAESSKNKRKRGGNTDYREDQEAIKKAKDVMTKLSLIKTLLEKCPPGEDETLSNSSKYFVRRIRPIVKCYEEHFNANIEEFMKVHPKVTHTKFNCSCMNKE